MHISEMQIVAKTALVKTILLIAGGALSVSIALVEAYPDDKYLPSYLVLAHHGSEYFHILFAVDVEGDNVRVVTAYRPGSMEWEANLKTRRSK
jgi:hypothetical protein